MTEEIEPQWLQEYARLHEEAGNDFIAGKISYEDYLTRTACYAHEANQQAKEDET